MNLRDATKEFEATFKEVFDGLAGPIAQNGETYIEVCSQGQRSEGRPIGYFDSEEAAVEAWRREISPFIGKQFLFWRIRPELGRDENEVDFITGEPNPDYGKYAVYSRFLSTDRDKRLS